MTHVTNAGGSRQGYESLFSAKQERTELLLMTDTSHYFQLHRLVLHGCRWRAQLLLEPEDADGDNLQAREFGTGGTLFFS